jgi:hypothetical protein
MSRYNLKEKNVAGIHAAPQPLKLLEGGFGNNEFGGKTSIASLVHPCLREAFIGTVQLHAHACSDTVED